jgi:predicted GH43/DUF377 family glycosyl hydrolase
MQKLTLSQQSPFIYSANQVVTIRTQEFPIVYETPTGPIFPENFFNGSILHYKDRMLFCCRADQRPWFENIRLVVCELDFNFVPKTETIKFLNVGSDRGLFHVEDPRLFICNDSINIVYGDGYKVYHAVLNDDLSCREWKNITTFGLLGIAEHDIREKNWTPFEYDNKVAVIYSDSPRVIFFPYTGKCVLSNQSIEWDFGQVRGGTPAIKWQGNYVTFFHSALNDNSKNWFEGRTYFVGAYVFEPKPPFRVISMTKIPLMKGEIFPDNPIAPIVKAVFPAGVARTHDSFYVSMGLNDSCTGVLRISKSLLEKILEKV